MSLNILVVDDSGVTRAMIGKTLRLAEIPVGELHEASNGQEALALLADKWVDLAFVDVNMPVMSGNEMVARMKEDPVLKTIPVVLVTSEGSTTRVGEMRALGVKAYLRKPFTPESLREVIEDVIGREESGKEVLLQTVFCDVMQNLAYMICDPIDKDDARGAKDRLLCAEMRFKGPVSGELSLLASRNVCRELVCNTLGVESSHESSRTLAADCLGEILNVTCGHLLTALVGEGPAFDLTVPSVRPAEPGLWDRYLDDPDGFAFSTENDIVLVLYRVEETEA